MGPNSTWMLWFFVSSLKGFFKEIFFGMGKGELEKRESSSDKAQYRKENPTVKDKIQNLAKNHVHLSMDWLMKRRRAVAALLLTLMLSLFVNFRLIQHQVSDGQKRIPTPNRDERALDGKVAKKKADQDKPVIPLPSKEERQQAYINIMKDLEDAYREH